jgi:Ca2+-binding RTX toxin-like protein
VHGGDGADTLRFGWNEECNPTACLTPSGAVFDGGAGDDVLHMVSPLNEGLQPVGAPLNMQFLGGTGRNRVDLSGVGFRVSADLGMHFASWYGSGYVEWTDLYSLHGSPRADMIRGSRGPDVIKGGRGADVIRSLRGNDHLFGGRGNDTLLGGRGHDVAYGGLGHDRCSAERRFSS